MSEKGKNPYKNWTRAVHQYNNDNDNDNDNDASVAFSRHLMNTWASINQAGLFFGGHMIEDRTA